MKRRTFNELVVKGSLIPFIPVENETMIKKKVPLKKGDTIGLITPSGRIDQSRIDKAKKNLEAIGFKVKYSQNVLAQKGYLAGEDKTRLNEIHAMYADPEVKGIWCIRGGYGATRILDHLDFNLIKKNPKPLLGYSDITALLNSIHQKTNSPCFHAPVASSNFSPYTKNNLAPIFGIKRPIEIEQAKENTETAVSNSDFESYLITSGRVEGKLCGGNLSLLAALMGTKHEVDTRNKIVFIEDIGEAPYRIDRMLTQLIAAGFFNKVKGIVLGVFLGCDKEKENTLSLKEVILDRIKPLGIPAVYGFSFGHIDHQCTFPIGANAIFDANNFKLTLTEDGY